MSGKAANGLILMDGFPSTLLVHGLHTELETQGKWGGGRSRKATHFFGSPGVRLVPAASAAPAGPPIAVTCGAFGMGIGRGSACVNEVTGTCG